MKAIPCPYYQLLQNSLANNIDLTNLAAALSAADGNLLSLLNGGDYTLLAPNNFAFEIWLATNGFTSMDEVPTDILENILSKPCH